MSSRKLSFKQLRSSRGQNEERLPVLPLNPSASSRSDSLFAPVKALNHQKLLT